MAPEGTPYRQPGKSTGLPFPRRGTRTYAWMLVAFGLVSAIAPLWLLGNVPGGLRSAIRNGGLGMYLLVLLVIAAAVIVAVLGTMLVRGRRVPVAAVIGTALLPMVVGLSVEAYTHRTITRGLGFSALDPSFLLRVAFEGMAEETNAPLYSALGCAVLLLGAAVASAGLVGTVDYARLSFRSGPLWIASALISLGWIVLGSWLVISVKAGGGALFVFALGLFASLVVLVLALIATRASVCLRGWHDADEARRIAGGIVCAALASALCLVLLDRAVVLYIERQVWTAVSAEGLSPTMRASLLHEWVVTQRTYAIVMVLHGVGALASFALAIVRAQGRGTSVVSRSVVVAFLLGVVTIGAHYGITSRRAGLIAEAATVARIEPDFSGEAPVVHDGTMLPLATRTPHVLGRAGGGAELPLFGVTAAAPPSIVFADAEKELALDVFAGEEREVPLELVVRSEVPVAPLSIDPEVAALVPVGPPVLVITALLPGGSDGERPGVRLGHASIQVLSAQHPSVTLHPGPALAEQLRATVDATASKPDIRIVVDRTATLQELCDVVAAFDRGWERVLVRVMPPDAPRTLSKP